MSTFPPDAELRRRFVHRPELSLLYNRAHGLEHRLNPAAQIMAAAVLARSDTEAAGPDVSPARRAALALALPIERAAADLAAFWDTILTAPDRPRPVRKSGAPADWAAVDVPFPLALEVEITAACNWHCTFCYNTWKVSDTLGQRSASVTGTAPGLHLPLDTARRILDQAAAGGCLRIRLSGGEPTLHPQFREIVEHASAAGFDLELFTNGVRVDDAFAAWLTARRVRVLLVSLHGQAATHNALALNPAAYTQAIGGIRAGVAAGMTVMAEALVSADNLAEMPAMVDTLRELGVAHVSFMPYVATGPNDPCRPVAASAVADLITHCRERTAGTVDFRVPCAPRHCLTDTPTAITAPVDEAFDDHCAAGLLWGSVSYDGYVRHCPHTGVVAGHVDEGIATVWTQRIVPTVRAALEPDNDACGGCGQFAACKGGCHLPKVRAYPGVEQPPRRLLPLATAAPARPKRSEGNR
ncbi:radical SAM protein [Embleya sp. NPDC005575]|uniref:radical SAM protein n=1 Tax=Embleya sp. NPDC005575 TaxID=3156892 RepID=UPI0033A03290